MSYTQTYYHIVLRTKNSGKTISQENISELYKYIWGIIKNKKSSLYRINGVEDHIHLFVSLHPAIALSDFVKTIKIATNNWMKFHIDFQDFHGWGEGYAAFTCRHRDKDQVVKYIMAQQKHHQKESFREEIIRIFMEEGIELDEYFLSWFDPLRGR